LLFEPTGYDERRQKENQWHLVQTQILETQSNRSVTAIIARENRITKVSEVYQQ